MQPPLMIDLFCGSFGWSQGWLELGGRVVGFDLEHEPHHGPVPRGADLVLQDVRTINGALFKDASLIVASSPCQEFSYRAMPWKRAKALGPPLLGIELFAQAERIQREAIAAAGHFIPMVQENVRGAQKYVGRARWHHGSYYLWGDVPALMPITLGRSDVKKVAIQSWSNFGKPGYVGEAFNHTAERATKNDGGSWFNVAHNKVLGNNPVRPHGGQIRHDPRYPHLDPNTADYDGVKQGGNWFNVEALDRDGQQVIARRSGSKSNARKAASARIAKIPFALAQHIARTYFPKR